MQSGSDICGRDEAEERLLRKGDSYQEILELLARDVQRMPEIMFLLEKEGQSQALLHSCRNLLPPVMLRIWEAYERGTSCGSSEDGYGILLEGAVQGADDRQLLRLVEIGKDFRPEVLRSFAMQLMKGERWQAAFSAFTLSTDQDVETDEIFWYCVGRCLYHLGELKGAEECLEKSLQIRNDYPPARTFLKWIREAEKV